MHIFAPLTGPRTKSFGANILPPFFLVQWVSLDLEMGKFCAWTCTSALMSLKLANLAGKRHKSSPPLTPFFLCRSVTSMVINRCVTSDVHIRSGALVPLFLGGLGWPD